MTSFYSSFHPSEALGAKGSAAFQPLTTNSASIFLYRRSSSTLSSMDGPNASVSYTFASGILDFSSITNAWSPTIPTGDSLVYVVSVFIASNKEIYTIGTSEWSTPVVLLARSTPSGSLTNPSCSLFAYANGVVVSYDKAVGEFKLLSGSTDISGSFTLSTVDNPQNLVVNYTGRRYEVTGGFDASEDTASLIIRATGGGDWTGVSIEKTFTLSKTRGGYEILPSLPGIGDPRRFEGSVVFLTTDNKLYRFNGTDWTAAVPATDVTGQLTNAQIAEVAAAKLTGTIVEAQIANAAITTAKFASGLRPVEVVSALPTTGNVEGRTVFLTTDGKLYRRVGTSWISTVPSTDITGQLSDSQLAGLAATKITGQITGTQITDNAISSPKIAAGAITAGKIAADAVTANEIAANAITATELSAEAVTAGKLAAGAVTAGTVAAGAITAGTIAAGAVNAAEIAAGSISASKLVLSNSALIGPDPHFMDAAWWGIAGRPGHNFVDAADVAQPFRFWQSSATGSQDFYTPVVPIERGKVYLFRLKIYIDPSAAGWIGLTWHLPMQAWFTPAPAAGRGDIDGGGYPIIDLANTSIPKGQWLVYDQRIAINSGVDASWIEHRYRSNLTAGYFQFAWEVSRAVDAELIVDGAVTANKIIANAVTADKIAANSVTADKIAANSVTAAKIEAGSVLADKIAANAVTADKINAGAVTAAKISVTQLSAISATIGTLRTNTTGARTEISDNVIKVFDASDVLRVRIGNLTL